MKITATQLSAAEIRRAFSWVDLVVLLGVFGLAWTILHFGQGMIVHFDESQSTEISTNILNIPYYAGRTVLRMWVAFGFSLLQIKWLGNMAHLDFAGDLSLLGDWCVHGSRGSMERTEMVIRPEKEEEEAKEKQT